MAAAVMLLMGVTSCNKVNETNPDEGKTGNLTISFLIGDEENGTRAATSTAKPITEWSKISNMMIMFTDASGLVQDARDITNVPTSGAAQLESTFMSVKANSTAPGWITYIVGNYPSSWTAGNVVGQNISALTITADPLAAYATSPHFLAGSTGYGEAPEVFVARANTVINPDTNNDLRSTPFTLARVVSLIRVRIDQTPNDNTKVEFATNGMFSVRRATTTYSLSGTYTYTGGATSPGSYVPAATNGSSVFYASGGMNTVNPSASDYSNNGTLVGSDNISLWKDYLIWSGGHATSGGSKFDIVLSGTTTDATYVPFGQTATVLAGTRVFWSGAVDQHVGPNQILELKIKLNTRGTTIVPPIGSYGDLQIAVNLLPWGDIIGEDVIL